MKRPIRTVSLIAAGALLSGAAWAQSSSAPAGSNDPQAQGSQSTQSSTHQHSNSKMEMSTTNGKNAALASFAKKAAIGGMAEVELGRLAAEKASNPQVKQFGQRMVDDHTKANDELKKAAREEGIDLPSETDAKSKKTMEKLSALSGDAFDKAYMKDMVKDHKEDVAEFRKASMAKSDSPVKQFAAKTLPTLEDHLKMAQDVDKQVGGSTGMMHSNKTTSKSSGSR